MPRYNMFTSAPVNPGRQVDRLTDQQVDKYKITIMPCTPIFTSGPVNSGRQVDRSTGEQERNTHNALHSYIYLWTCQTW